MDASLLYEGDILAGPEDEDEEEFGADFFDENDEFDELDIFASEEDDLEEWAEEEDEFEDVGDDDI